MLVCFQLAYLIETVVGRYVAGVQIGIFKIHDGQEIRIVPVASNHLFSIAKPKCAMNMVDVTFVFNS
jgi:hypothetical protein